jgi:hypothetical protein
VRPRLAIGHAPCPLCGRVGWEEKRLSPLQSVWDSLPNLCVRILKQCACQEYSIYCGFSTTFVASLCALVHCVTWVQKALTALSTAVDAPERTCAHLRHLGVVNCPKRFIMLRILVPAVTNLVCRRLTDKQLGRFGLQIVLQASGQLVYPNNSWKFDNYMSGNSLQPCRALGNLVCRLVCFARPCTPCMHANQNHSLRLLPVALHKRRIDLAFNEAGMVENLAVQRNGRFDSGNHELAEGSPHARQGGAARRLVDQ